MNSHVTTGELKPALNEISIGPWIPSYENYIAICAQRPVAEDQVEWRLRPARPGPRLFAFLQAAQYT
jgi:hypothetical protein